MSNDDAPPSGKPGTVDRRLCAIYKSAKKDEMYLYVDKKDELKRVPEALLGIFGMAIPVTTMLIDTDRKLARADARQVLADIESRGFYLQMPAPRDPYMLSLYDEYMSRNSVADG
jgi:uncharacterized protein YcgL (UPF0745 family)